MANAKGNRILLLMDIKQVRSVRSFKQNFITLMGCRYNVLKLNWWPLPKRECTNLLHILIGIQKWITMSMGQMCLAAVFISDAHKHTHYAVRTQSHRLTNKRVHNQSQTFIESRSRSNRHENWIFFVVRKWAYKRF